MNRITHIFTTTLLLTLANLMVATTRSPADIQPKVTTPQQPPQSIVAPKGRELVARFECRSRGSDTGEISLQANGKYQAKQQTGKYLTTPVGYQFTNGALRGQSIVRQAGNIYLVSTKQAARAAEIAAADGALFCTGGEIKY
jgi:hypothetical protein